MIPRSAKRSRFASGETSHSNAARARGVCDVVPLQALSGLRHYYVAIDREKGFLTNVSIWDSLEHAHQVDQLQPMLAQRPILEAAGVRFEPITNHETLWTIDS